MNCHDFTTPIKTALVEKLAEVLPGDLNGFQFYDSGTTAVEAGLRVMRAATKSQEMISCFYDYHGKPIRPFAGCVTPQETALSHKLFTAALESQRETIVSAL